MDSFERDGKRIVALISGTGQALQGLIEAVHLRETTARLVAVVSHDRWSYGLLRAEREGIPAFLHDFTDYRVAGKHEREYVDDLTERIADQQPDLVILAGWQRPLNERFYQRFPNRVLALQSGARSPLQFDPYERNAVSRIFEAFTAGMIRETQVSVEQPTTPMHHGPIVAQRTVPIYPTDRPVDLEDRMHRTQQELLVHTLHLLLRE